MTKILKLNEYNNYTSLSEDELLEMANITDSKTGIKNVVLWVGPNPKYHAYRIKVSNLPNSFKPNNCFTITIPDYNDNVIGDVNGSLINIVPVDIILTPSSLPDLAHLYAVKYDIPFSLAHLDNFI